MGALSTLQSFFKQNIPVWGKKWWNAIREKPVNSLRKRSLKTCVFCPGVRAMCPWDQVGLCLEALLVSQQLCNPAINSSKKCFEVKDGCLTHLWDRRHTWVVLMFKWYYQNVDRWVPLSTTEAVRWHTAGCLGNEHCDVLENQNSLNSLKPLSRYRNGIKEKKFWDEKRKLKDI